MFKANSALLETIIATLPFFKSNGDVLSNCAEALKILDREGIVDSREIELLSCIRTMLNYMNNNVEFDNENIIRMSSSNQKMADDIIAKSQSISEETKDWVRKFIDLVATKGEIIRSVEKLLQALEDVENAPNHMLLKKMDALTNTIENVVVTIDKKTTKKQNSSVIFGSKIKGMSTIIDQFRYEEKNALSCGIPVVDELVGGYRPKKLYCNIALTGGFKSGFLENVTMGMRSATRNVEKVDGMENAILHITFENDLLQIFKRFIDYSKPEKFYSKKNLKGMSDNEILDLASECLAPKEEGDMTIVVQQYPRYSLAPHHLNKIVSDLKRENIRVLAIIIDYADLMAAPAYDDGDVEDTSKMPIVRKFEHLKLIAQKLSVPIITAGQFNRQGENEAKLARKKYPSPLMGGLNASHVAGGYGLKFHVESMIIQFRGAYNGTQLLHFLLDKDRDGNAEDSESSKEASGGNVMRFVKFQDNGFRISPDPNDAYQDIRDVVPLDDGGIIAAAFKSVDVNAEIKKQMQEKANANKEVLDLL